MAEAGERWKDAGLGHGERADDLIARLTLEEKVSQLGHDSPAIERLGIPAYDWWNEALHGVARAGRATVFPQAIGLAATFDPALMERIADVISTEARAKYHAAVRAGHPGRYRGLTFWSPNVNIVRDPRWGRAQETYGEDPWLTARMGVAYVRGMQQEKDGVMKAAACAKHFAVHSGPEALRHEFDAVVSAQDLRSTYLPAFEALVREGHVEAVMGAYNRVNGEPCCASPTLLDGILRDEWGFEGHVVSDCWAIQDLHEHHGLTRGPVESAAEALQAGCDLNCGCTYAHALDAVREGLLPEATIDRALRRLLVTRFKLGLLDEKEGDPWRDIPLEVVDAPEHRALAREAAEASIVLLKNDGVLPLSEDLGSLHVTGPNADNPRALMGNYHGLNPRVVTPLQGLAARVPERTSLAFTAGALLDREKPHPEDWSVGEAGQADVTVAFLGLDGTLEGEEGDAVASASKGDRDNLGLPPGQLDFLRRMKEAGATLVVVLTGGSALAVPEVHELADALLVVWYPGEEAGTALSRVLYGDVSPSGRLPVTFYEKAEDLPPFEDYAMEGRTYRYFQGEPLYPFGFGLSYTRFAYEGGEVSGELAPGRAVEVAAAVTNVGAVRGREVVQLYAIPPAAPYPTPRAELRGVRCVELDPGQSARVALSLRADDLGLWDDTGRPRRLPGAWTIEMGGCSPGARGFALGAAKPTRAQITVRDG